MAAFQEKNVPTDEDVTPKVLRAIADTFEIRSKLEEEIVKRRKTESESNNSENREH
jgi:hypothetical protein